MRDPYARSLECGPSASRNHAEHTANPQVLFEWARHMDHCTEQNNNTRSFALCFSWWPVTTHFRPKLFDITRSWPESGRFWASAKFWRFRPSLARTRPNLARVRRDLCAIATSQPDRPVARQSYPRHNHSRGRGGQGGDGLARGGLGVRADDRQGGPARRSRGHDMSGPRAPRPAPGTGPMWTFSSSGARRCSTPR